MKHILKMIYLARKYPNNKAYLYFNAWDILPNNKDFDWAHEDEKCDWVKRFIERAPEIPLKQAKKAIKQCFWKYANQMCFYPAFIECAKQINGRYKRGGK